MKNFFDSILVYDDLNLIGEKMNKSNINFENTKLFYLNYIEKKFKDQTNFSLPQYAKIVGKDKNTIYRYIRLNQLHKLPKFSIDSYMKNNGDEYNRYTFKLYDIVNFLAGESQ